MKYKIGDLIYTDNTNFWQCMQIKSKPLTIIDINEGILKIRLNFHSETESVRKGHTWNDGGCAVEKKAWLVIPKKGNEDLYKLYGGL